MPEPFRVLVVDDHTLVREGVRLLLNSQPDFLVVAEAAGGQAAVRLAAECNPDLILMDVRMPDLDGIQALEQIRRRAPLIKVLMLSMFDDRDVLLNALRAGARGYVLKGASSNELLEALRVVARGEVYLSPRMATLLVGEFLLGRHLSPGGEFSRVDILSPREQEVLRRLAQGQTNAEIASELVISASTVQTHRTRILEKLGLKTRSDMVKFALRNGLICLD